jgi:hypothetical protein
MSRTNALSASAPLPSGDLDPLVEDRPLARLEESLHPPAVILVMAGRDDRVVEGHPDGLFARPAEDGLGARVPVPDDAVLVHDHDRVECVGDDLPRQLPALTQRTLGLQTLRRLDRQGGDVGQRSGEPLLLLRPDPRWSDVLVTDDADHVSPGVERRVQHRGDAVHTEVALRELARPRIPLGVVCDDRSLFVECPEVVREVGSRELDSAGGVLSLRALVVLDAADLGAVVAEEPHVDPLDFHRMRGGLGDLSQGGLEVTTDPGLTLREPPQHLVVLPELAVVLGQDVLHPRSPMRPGR